MDYNETISDRKFKLFHQWLIYLLSLILSACDLFPKMPVNTDESDVVKGWKEEEPQTMSTETRSALQQILEP